MVCNKNKHCMSILKLMFFKHVSVKLQGSSGGVVYLILIFLMKILTVITKLMKWDVNSWRREGWKLFSQWLASQTFSTKSEFYSICSCVQLQPYITWHNTPILLAHVSSQTIHFNGWGSFSWIKIYRGFAKFS